MSNEEKTYSREFKAKVVLEAVSGEQATPREVADKHDVTPAQILAWANEMDISEANLARLKETVEGPVEQTATELELETGDEVFAREVSFGATFDILNYPRLVFWSVFGTIFVLLTIIALMFMYDYSIRTVQQQVAAESEYHELRDLKLRDQERLTSFGVVDLENRIYRIPIDSAITRMTEVEVEEEEE